MSALLGLVRQSAASVELTLDGTPVVAPVTVSTWGERGDLLSTAVRFGPYPSRVRANGVRLTLNGEPEAIELGEMTLPAGVSFKYDLRIKVGRT